MALTSVRDVFTKMPEVFNATAAQGMDKVFQFDLSGEDGGKWYIVVKDDACEVHEGTHEDPSVTLTMSDEDWLAMVNKQLNGVQAFMSGKLKVSGDIMLAQRIYDLFPL
jgi:putative sterol carrier protein